MTDMAIETDPQPVLLDAVRVLMDKSNIRFRVVPIAGRATPKKDDGGVVVPKTRWKVVEIIEKKPSKEPPKAAPRKASPRKPAARKPE